MVPRYLAHVDPRRLPRVEARVIVLGSGIAGLFTALRLAEKGPVTLITKQSLADSNTELAQGGIAAAIGESDSPELHLQDTLVAGDGLCDRVAVEALVHEGPERVRELAALGVEFDRGTSGFALTREAAHSQRRILHAHGDATGDEIRRGLEQQVRCHPQITLLEDHFALDIVTEPLPGGGAMTTRGWPDDRLWQGQPAPLCQTAGVVVMRPDGEAVLYQSSFVVLATGGSGQLYRTSTNPEVATADGVAMAYRSGAAVADLEFVQFHPTAMAGEGGRKFLISESVRGEGALLHNVAGERFMSRYDSRAELAPRDIVARAIAREMVSTGSSHVWLDAGPIGEAFPERFPTIFAACMERGIDPRKDPIPVAPAAHYAMGGVLTDSHGRTTLRGLFACGETACTGLHGANRLASNSLVEGVVFGNRIADLILALEAGDAGFDAPLPGEGYLPHRWLGTAWPEAAVAASAEPVAPALPGIASPEEAARLWAVAQELMWRDAGIVRNAAGLAEAWQGMAGLCDAASRAGLAAGREALELANLTLAGSLVARAALARTESRGGHFREDCPDRDDAAWQLHIVQQREENCP